MVAIDLRAQTVPLSQRAWRLFPGTSYQFLTTFLEGSLGFLDFPALNIPSGNLNGISDLISRIALSQNARELMRQHGPDAQFATDLAAFAKAHHTKNRGRLRQALINFYQEAKADDLVVLPEPLGANQILVGRFVSNDVEKALFPRRYGQNTIPARSIRWVHRFKENMISTALSEKLRQTHPFTLLEKSLYPEVLSLAYGSFSFGELKAATVLSSAGFLDTDAAFLGNISRLSAAACVAIAKNEKELGLSGILSAILGSPPIEYTCSQEADIHSPGFLRYLSATVVPLVISALVAAFIFLGQTSNPISLQQDVQNLHFVNSATNADPHVTAMVSDASNRVLQSLGIDNTWKLCEAAKAAHDRAGLRPTAGPRR